ncbi:MAG: response regulator [Kofleriaceae bacterium]
MRCERMVLRAELSHEGREIVAHTTELSAESAVVRTDEPLEVGDPVQLRLSFRRLLAPIQLAARVSAKEPGAGLGYFPGVTLAFESLGDDRRERIERLLSSQDAEAASSSRILVVEDSAIMRDFVQIGADRFSGGRAGKVVVDTAESAETALALLDEHRYELALVDLYLPGSMNGDDLVRAACARGHTELAMIGFSIGGAAARDAFLSAGADLFLDKPVTVKDLFATVQRLNHPSLRGGEA